jgi:hypothetical protein
MVSLKNPFLHWRLLDKETGEGAHTTHPRYQRGKCKERIVLTHLNGTFLV